MQAVNFGMVSKIKIPIPSIEEQERIVAILDRFDTLCNDISEGLPAEIEGRRKQYEYYRDKMLFKLFFAPKHLIKGDDATFGLLKMSIEIFFWVAKWAATLFTVFAIAYIPLKYIVEAIPVLPIMSNVLLGCFAFSSFLLSRMFRMASIEVDKIEDRSLLFGIFASVASIVSIVIAIVAIVK